LCLLESETKDIDLRRECITTLGYLSQAQLSQTVIPTFLSTINEVCKPVMIIIIIIKQIYTRRLKAEVTRCSSSSCNSSSSSTAAVLVVVVVSNSQRVIFTFISTVVNEVCKQ